MKRALLHIFEFLAAFAGLTAIIVALVVWKLNQGPLTSHFLTPYMATGIEMIVPGSSVAIGSTVLSWSTADATILLHAHDIAIQGEKGALAVASDMQVDLNLSSLLLGQIVPKRLTIDHPQIDIVRAKDGEIDLGAADMSGGDKDISGIVMRSLGALTDSTHTNRLDITRAIITIHDPQKNIQWAVRAPEIHLAHKGKNVTGEAHLDVSQGDRLSPVQLHYSFDSETMQHQISARFADLIPAQFGGGDPARVGMPWMADLALPLSGHIDVTLDDKLHPVAFNASLHADAGQFIDPKLWDKPRDVSSLDLEADYDGVKHKLNVTRGDIDFGGPALSLTVTGNPSADTAYDLETEANIKLTKWPMDEFGELWPKSIITNARRWIVANMTKGMFDQGEVNLKTAISFKDLENPLLREGSGTVTASNAHVTYIDGMPPIENISTTSEFDLDHMVLHISGGGIGAIKLSPFSLQFLGFQNDTQTIDIPMKLAGPVPDILRLINMPPLRYADAIGLKPDDLSGSASGMVRLRFPLIDNLELKDIDVSAKASLTNLSSDRLVSGAVIEQGTFGLDLDKDGFSLEGPLVLNKLPVQLKARQNFSVANKRTPKRQASLSGKIDMAKIVGMGVEVLAGSTGIAGFNIGLTQTSGDSTLLSGTLEFGQATIKFSQAGWTKPSGEAAFLKFSAETGKDHLVDITSLKLLGKTVNVSGSASVDVSANRLRVLHLHPAVIGRTNADIDYDAIAPDGGRNFVASGTALDIAGIKQGDDAKAQTGLSYKMKLQRLYTSQNGFIDQVDGAGQRDTASWQQLSLHGQADGNHPLAIDLAPKPDGGRTLLVTSDDFGAMLKGLGMTETVHGGKVEIYGDSTVAAPEQINGKIKVGGFKVRNLPLLATLLNATSPFGFFDILTDGDTFSSLEGKFRWTNDMIEISHLRAGASTYAINADGKVNLADNTANLSGTIVPFSLINRMLEAIPLVGDLITGGDGQGILALSYTIKGALSDPRVNVNPVSLLTPGFVRNLIFNNDDEESSPSPAPDLVKNPSIQALPTPNNINQN